VPDSQCQKYRLINSQFPLVFLLFGTLILSVMTGCAGFTSVDAKFASSTPARGVHIVKPGETLYSIAFRYGWDYKTLASTNSIASPFTIYPGQKIRFHKVPDHGPVLAKVPQKSTKNLTNNQVSAHKGAASAYKNRSNTPKSTSVSTNTAWNWPASGEVIAKFSPVSPVNKGIDIAGRLGEPVLAAAAGTVVYAGSGLLGYGNLVIIKHNDRFLSAYAHSKRLLVKENQQVKARQPIAEIGSSGTDKVKLHFEIRRDGKPVNPMRYLPKNK